MTSLAAIQTEYAGCRFRSRLEARWAIFFERLGLEWVYEPQGFHIPSVEGASRGYLPDFWLPDLEVWVEVKGVLTVEELNALIVATSTAGLGPSPSAERCPPNFGYPWQRRILLLGNVPEPQKAWAHFQLGLLAESLVVAQRVFFAKTTSGKWRLIWLDEPWLLNQYLTVVEPTAGILRDLVGGLSAPLFTAQELVTDAYRAARSARFEYGESGA